MPFVSSPASFFALALLSLVSLTARPMAARAGDWPLWRYDAMRSAASPHPLPPDLKLHWVRQLPRLTPCWLDQPKMHFDAAYEPIVAGQRLFIGSSHSNSVTAYDTRTGEEAWVYFANAPVRFAPLAWRDKLFFACDDGYLYCLKASDGVLAWRFRGGPSDRTILGNERLISMWPARGAPVIADDKIYFAAGIWPFMGIFLHALDAESGRLLWTNDGDGSIYIKQPHNADSFAGVAPQGPLVAIGPKLLIPGGRSVPACYDRATGKMLYYQLADNAKRGGGSSVSAVDQLLLNGGAAFDLANESYLGPIGELVTFSNDRLYDYRNREVRALDLKSSSVALQDTVDRKGAAVKTSKWTIKDIGKTETPTLTALIKAGPRLYAGTSNRLLTLGLPGTDNSTTSSTWEAEIEGTPVSLVAADDRLFAVTLEGSVYCFGSAASSPATPPLHALPAQPIASNPAAKSKAESLLTAAGTKEGYCLLFSAGSSTLARELSQQTNLRLIAIEPDATAANALRAEFKAAGIGAERATIIVADPVQIDLPAYLSSLTIVASLPSTDRAEFVAKVFASLRPFGGVACLPLAGKDAQELADSLRPFELAGAAWKPAGDVTLLTRDGPLRGTADWTHEHADAANTRVSKDTVVKAPLGLLWFGGPTNDAILPRHGHGPQPQVVDGRLIIEGMDLLRAMDIYTGRLLWEASLPGVGALYDNTAHQPGANASGTNYIAAKDGIYVAYGKSCLRLDPATGQKTAEFQLPAAPGGSEPPVWGYLNVADQYLVGGAEPLFNPGLANSRGENDNHASSSRLAVLDRASGKVLWTITAKSGFRHNGICIGGGRLYCIDRVSGPELSRLKRRGEDAANEPRLLVFDLASGKQLWSTEHDVFGTWLSYSAERDVLVEAGRVASDTISDEPKGMRAYRADTGLALWENKSYSGPAMLHHDTILMAGKACDLLSGSPRMRQHPISGEPVEWTWSRNYGCNTPMASEHLLTFRSGAAGYLDFCNDGGTGNFGGFRSSCSNNLIVAGGLLTAPDYTRTCICSYQNQTSIALVPMSDVETWTSFGAQTPKQPVRRLGVNLAAPGDRKADDGTLWLEYPSVGGNSPTVDVQIEPTGVEWFRRHSSQIEGPGLSWVAASGAKGLTSLRIKLADADSAPRQYTVRLHFLEPDDVKPDERVFSVSIQGAKWLPTLDVVQAAGGTNRSLVKEINNVTAAESLLVELAPASTSKHSAAILSGVEIQIQDR
jgi:outer membrane protein assembly factor BamB